MKPDVETVIKRSTPISINARMAKYARAQWRNSKGVYFARPPANHPPPPTDYAVREYGVFSFGFVCVSEQFNPQQPKKQMSDFLVRPFFDTSVSSNITTQLGGHAYMPCRVKQLGNKSVSPPVRPSVSHGDVDNIHTHRRCEY